MHGEFLDFPCEMVIGGLSDVSPQLFRGATTIVAGSLAAEALAS